MKAFSTLVCAVGGLLLLAGCELQTLTIKAKPSVAYPFGSRDLDLGTFLSAQTFADAIGANNPNSKVQIVSTPIGGKNVFTIEYSDAPISAPLKNFIGSGSQFDLSSLNIGTGTPVSGSIKIANFAPSSSSFTINWSTPPGYVTGSPFGQNLVLTGNLSLPLGTTPPGFVKADVAAGTMTIDLPDPNGLTPSATPSLAVQISQNGQVIYSNTATGNPYVFYLAGVTLKGGDLAIAYTYTLPNPTASKTSGTATASTSTSLSSMANLVYNDPNLANFFKPVTNNTPYPASLTGYVAAIAFKNPNSTLIAGDTTTPPSDMYGNARLNLTFTNGLPFDIGVTVNSNTLGITSGTANFAKLSSASSSSTINATKYVIDFGTENAFDFSLSVNISNGGSFDPATGNITITGPINVATATTYSYSGSFGLDLTPASVKIKGVNIPSQSYPTTPIDISGLNKVLPPRLDFSASQIMLYVSAGGVDGVTGNFSLTPTYTKPVASNYSAVPVTFSATPAETGINLGQILTDRPSNLQFAFGVNLNQSYINLTSLGTASFKAGFRLVIPLAWSVTNDPGTNYNWIDSAGTGKNGLNLDFGMNGQAGNPKWPLDFTDPAVPPAPGHLAVNGSNTDLFGRTVPVPDDNWNRAFQSLEGASITLNSVKNTTGVQLAVTMEYYDESLGTWTTPREVLALKPTGQSSTFALTPTELQYIKTHLFKPVFRLAMPAGSYSFGYNPALILGMNVHLKTNIDQTIQLK